MARNQDSTRRFYLRIVPVVARATQLGYSVRHHTGPIMPGGYER